MKYTFRLALPAFFIPYLFVEHRVLLLEDFGIEGILRLIQVTLFMTALSVTLVGNFKGKMNATERLMLLASCAAMLNPDNWSTLIGAGVVCLILGRRLYIGRQAAGVRRDEVPASILAGEISNSNGMGR